LVQTPGDTLAVLGCVPTQPAGCGICTPWHAVQNELLWHLVQTPGDEVALLGCVPTQPAGCGICRPWHAMQLFLPWHLTHFDSFLCA